LINNYHLWFTR